MRQLTLETFELESTPVHTLGYVKLHSVSHEEKEYSQIFINDGVSILVINDRKEILMVKVVRPSAGVISWELPGGGIDEGESPRFAAAREVLEETSFVLNPDKLLYLGNAVTDVSIISSKIHMFLQKVDVTHCNAVKPDLDEILETKWWHISEFEEAILKNVIIESATIMAWTKARLMRVI